MRGYAWAFAATLANASQDNLRKMASNRVKNPIAIVALSELFNVSVQKFPFLAEYRAVCGPAAPAPAARRSSSNSMSPS